MFADYMEEVQAEAVEELTNAILEAAQEVMSRHGDDPKMAVVISAAFACSLDVIGKDEASIPPTVLGMLERMAKSREAASASRH